MSRAAGDFAVVGRIGKAHGLRGELSVELRTDEPERRYADGAVLQTRSARTDVPATLSVATTRWHQGRLLVRFVEVPDRETAETVRGTELVVPVDPDESPEDPEEYYDHQLVGLRAETAAGELIGEVSQVVHGAGQDLLVIGAVKDGREVLVPFVHALVPEVDVAGGRLVVDDRPGLVGGDD